MIGREREKDEVIYKCVECDKILAELIDSGEVIIHGGCIHYKWVEVSSQCFYTPIPGCGKGVMQWLKENHILKLDDSGTVHLLIPRKT